MLEEFGRVNGLLDISFTSLRRGMEPKVQSNNILQTWSKDVTNHDPRTGSKYYDNSRPAFRAGAMNYINKLEGSKEEDYMEDEEKEEIASKRAKLDDEEEEESINNAKKVLRSAKRKVPLGSRCQLESENRSFIQEQFSAGGKFEDVFSGYELFPGKID